MKFDFWSMTSVEISLRQFGSDSSQSSKLHLVIISNLFNSYYIKNANYW
jgi:hypothetical protein